MDKEDEQDLHTAKNLHQHFDWIYRLKYLDHIVHRDDRDPREKTISLFLIKS